MATATLPSYPSSYACNPVCPDSCASLLPKVKFEDCFPSLNYGQIEWLYLSNRGYPLQDWTSPVEWNARIVKSDFAPDQANDIIQLRGVGSKPKPNSNIKIVSGGRRVVGVKTHQLAFKVDDTNDTNHAAFRRIECGGNFLLWYQTRDGRLHGGNCGIEVFINPDYIVPEDYGQLITWEMAVEWDAKFTEEITVSPIVNY